MEDRGVYLVIGFTDEGRSFEYTQEKAQEVEKRLIPLLQAEDSPYSRFIMRVPGFGSCLLYTSPSPRDATLSRMPSSA